MLYFNTTIIDPLGAWFDVYQVTPDQLRILLLSGQDIERTQMLVMGLLDTHRGEVAESLVMDLLSESHVPARVREAMKKHVQEHARPFSKEMYVFLQYQGIIHAPSRVIYGQQNSVEQKSEALHEQKQNIYYPRDSFHHENKDFTNGGKTGSYKTRGPFNLDYQYKTAKNMHSSVLNFREFMASRVFSALSQTMNKYNEKAPKIKYPDVYLSFGKNGFDLASKYLLGQGDINQWAKKQSITPCAGARHVVSTFRQKAQKGQVSLSESETAKRTLARSLVLSAALGDHDVNSGNFFVMEDGSITRIDFGHAWDRLLGLDYSGSSVIGGGRVDHHNSMVDYFDRSRVCGFKTFEQGRIYTPSKFKLNFDGVITSSEFLDELQLFANSPPLSLREESEQLMHLVHCLGQDKTLKKDVVHAVQTGLSSLVQSLSNSVASYRIENHFLNAVKHPIRCFRASSDLNEQIRNAFHAIEASVELKKHEASKLYCMLQVRTEKQDSRPRERIRKDIEIATAFV